MGRFDLIEVTTWAGLTVLLNIPVFVLNNLFCKVETCYQLYKYTCIGIQIICSTKEFYFKKYN
jgi:hypothetical protein